MPKRLPPLPEKIEYGYRTIIIRTVDSNGISEKHGETDTQKSTITVDKSTHANDIEGLDTVIHEFFHFVYHDNHLGKPNEDDEVEERVVSIMANAVIESFRRNPKFLEWFYRHMKENFSGDSGS